jgi:serine/threonine protein kinase
LQNTQDIQIGRLAFSHQYMTRDVARACLEEAGQTRQSFLSVAVARHYLNSQQAQSLWAEFQRLSAGAQVDTGFDSRPGSASGAQGSTAITSGSASSPFTVVNPSQRPSTAAYSASGSAEGQGLPEIGDVIDGYEVKRLLGKGGMGAVYRVEKGTKEYALKVIITENDIALARFEREAIAAAKVDIHPNIVRIYSYAKFRGKPYILSDFVKGCGLDEFITRGHSFGIERTLEIVHKVGLGLDFIHRNGIIHRDLKPANILIRGEDNEPLITDFGLARLSDSSTLTKSQDFLGTPSYMAPEQAGSEHKEVGPAADIWAMGVILYELCTGELPFRGETPVVLITRIIMGDPEKPRSINPDIPMDVEAMILKALEKEQGDRYESAGALARDCEKVLNGEAIDARRFSSMVAFQKKLKRRLGVVGFAFVVAVLALGFVALTLTGLFWIQNKQQRVENNRFNQDLGKLLKRFRDFQKRQALPLLGNALLGGADETSFAQEKSLWKQLKKDSDSFRKDLVSRNVFVKNSALLELINSHEFIQAALTRDLANMLPSEDMGFTFSKQQKLYLLARQQSFQNHNRQARVGFEKLITDHELLGRLGFLGLEIIAIRENDMEGAWSNYLELEEDRALAGLSTTILRREMAQQAMMTLINKKPDVKLVERLVRVVKLENLGLLFWHDWSRNFTTFFREKKNLESWTTAKSVAVWQRINKKLPRVTGMKAPDLDRPMHVYLAKKAEANNQKSLALNHYLAIRKKDKSFQFPPGFRPFELAEFVFELMGLVSGDEKVDKKAFQFIMTASRAGIYIPVHRQTVLVRFERRGLFADALDLNPEDDLVYFWRGMVPIQYYEKLRVDNKKLLLRDFERQNQNLTRVINSKIAPGFRAVALNVRISLQQLWCSYQPKRAADNKRWCQEAQQALDLKSPKPEDLYCKLWAMQPAGPDKVEWAQKRIEAIKRRRERTRDEQLGKDRPWECPLTPLDRGEFERLMMFAQVSLLETHLELRNYKAAREAGLKALDAQPQSGFALTRYGESLLFLKDYKEFERVFTDFHRKYGFNESLKAQWANFQQMNKSKEK